MEYKYNKKDNKFTENGHTMFEFDVLQRLKRLSYLEKNNKELLEALKKVQLQVGQIKHNWDYREKTYMPFVTEALKKQ